MSPSSQVSRHSISKWLLLTRGLATYIGICGCAAGLGPLTAYSTITLTYGNFAATTMAMSTTTQLCSNCGVNGGPSTVTVTVPYTNAVTPIVTVGYNGSGTYNGPFVGSNSSRAGVKENIISLVVFMLVLCFITY